jgi:hypothetical protein
MKWKKEGKSLGCPQSIAGAEDHQAEGDTQHYYGIVYMIAFMSMRENPRCYAKHK